jgi:separase
MRGTRSRLRRFCLFKLTRCGLRWFAHSTNNMPARRQPTGTFDKESMVATATTRTTTRARATRTTTTNDLASKLETNLTISDPEGKQKPTNTTVLQRDNSSTRTTARRTKTADGETASDVATLAKDLANDLTIGSRSSGKTKEERCMAAMRVVNSGSKSLSGVIESGWKASSAPAQRNSGSKFQDHGSTATKHAIKTRQALNALRELKPGDVDVERASSSFIGKLVTLEMVHGLFLSIYSDYSHHSIS